MFDMFYFQGLRWINRNKFLRLYKNLLLDNNANKLYYVLIESIYNYIEYNLNMNKNIDLYIHDIDNHKEYIRRYIS